jgi:hypothetical protein
MTLFIACVLIHGFNLGWGWYGFALTVWLLHLVYHAL